MADLFTTEPRPPLAELIRPKTIDEVVGQRHLLGPGKPLRLAFEARKLHSFILWGPPGVGKTTLGRLAARATNANFIAISAVLAGVKDIRQAIEDAQGALDREGKSTVLFVDEIHRFNKAQQDALLPHVESGLLTLVGGTTEHPGIEVNNALLSRAQVYTLHPFTGEELQQLYERALPQLSDVTLTGDALDLLKGFADGDGRRFLNLLEQVSNAASGAGLKEADLEFAKNSTSPSLRRFDKGGDAHYELISALHKSVRGSSVDASLYWLARMLEGGADGRYLARRLVRMAVEDIGLADPRAMQVTLNAAEVYDRLGSPEGELALAEATVYLCIAPKSNAVYNAWNQVQAFIKKDGSRDVPIHLRNAPTKLMKQMGYGKAYRYAHDEPHAYAANENYFPDGMPTETWYEPTDRGMEQKIGEKLAWLKSLDDAARRGEP
ncbi:MULTISPECIES: replication-associated recombination protein A [Ramlibacter]|uniref:Replication-associated recombination protein A n=1 Tax=Ramlibacter pinisoli TaxID=2682844 RepID=A0A6N8IS40_9BURK|nr:MULTISPECIES: replication-associated recombination protein A [Ramlibacter]MBA2964683.1 replication-associated recombination protein A [Ramlibacter sp. CGMCC 1.13660]MVQ29648.1 AAA family ATPase [Ramlibacter pinisoli]